ncbi:hypothetical protein [Candidatus Poriferisocius sp.]|uniref:hypothetical protein n=1 Tax=Candidatus Poriferisocius sp. TaxID=3101276 RepID=UPI003B01DE0A
MEQVPDTEPGNGEQPDTEPGNGEQPEPGNGEQPEPDAEPDNGEQPEPETTSVDSQSTAGETGATPGPEDGSSFDDDNAQAVPMPVDDSDFGEHSEQPQRAGSANTADYITKLMVWLVGDDGGREVGECYANAFLETIEGDRLEIVADAADTTRLDDKLPDDLLTEAEMSLFVENTQRCAEMGIRKVLDIGWLLENADMDPGTVTLPPDVARVVSECAEMMVADTTTLEMFTLSTLFSDTDGEAEQYLEEKLLEQCGEEVLNMLLAVGLAITSSLDYEAALCMLNIDLGTSSQIDDILEEMFSIMENMMDGMSEENMDITSILETPAMSALADALSDCDISPEAFNNLIDAPSDNQSTPG